MSIFLALVFQVLFVFFAMVINIGLLVHDKINLQNSVDLGAYYAAQKQSEILNEIAHLNYQIRQDYKLLAWRYWVLGTLGRDAHGPPTGLLNPPSSNPNPMPDAPRLYSAGGAQAPTEEVPIACLANLFWWEFARLSGPGVPPNENYCWKKYDGQPTPSIPIPHPPFTPATAFANSFATMFAQASQQNFGLSCQNASPLSWAFVAAILADYKFSIAYKKKAIKKLRENLVSANPLDRDGRPIKDGVIATIQRNLTESNLASFNAGRVAMLNGLTLGSCAGGNTPGANTLPEILTQPGLYFALLNTVGNNACTFNSAFQTQFAQVAGGIGAITPYDPDGTLRSLVGSEPTADDQYHSTLGFEKNPWCMAYMGVKATTSPRKPFAPFGKSVNLEARAFAQPFGGRIGPWYSNQWDRGDLTSKFVPAPTVPANAYPMNPVLPDQATRTDPATSPRLVPGLPGFQYSSLTIPNYSRYPGDNLGLRSMQAQQLSRNFFFPAYQSRGVLASAAYTDNRIRLNWFAAHINFATAGDSLAWDLFVGGPQPVQLLNYRQIETAAIAPDLFDITYYSIDPEADENYVKLARNNPGRYGIAGAPVGDLGSRQTDALMQKYNIQEQIKSVNSVGMDQGLLPRAYWLVRKWENVLTGWAPHRASNFTFPIERFGECPGPAIPTAMIPGKCAAGGRSGYSVRLISREHLQGIWSVGGASAAPGPLMNPPGGDGVF